MKITFLTLFSDFFDRFIETSIINKAIKKKIVEIEVKDLKDYNTDGSKRMDAPPVGGGPGLIMKCPALINAIKDLKKDNNKIIYLSSRGIPFNQEKARVLANDKKDLVLLCGHYEGIDERVCDYIDEEISVGDYILTGGEIPAMVVADSVIRLLDGSISEESLLDESYENGLLEYPQYTLPREYDGKKIPDVLFSGDHSVIRKWRLKESLKITWSRRKDLLDKKELNEIEKELLSELGKGKWEEEAIKKSKRIRTHTLKLLPKYFDLINKGIKVYELRLNDEKRKKIKINDEICFLKEPDLKEYFYKKVVGLHYYKDFIELSKKLPLKEIGFENETCDGVNEVMSNIYCKENIEKYGVVAIELE